MKYLKYLNMVKIFGLIYINSLLQPFQNMLKSYNINLNKSQCLFLYSHPKFGIDINSWNPNDLFILLHQYGFSDKTLLMIAKGLKLCSNKIIQYIIYIILNTNNDSYLQLSYKKWIFKIKEYTEDINELSKENFYNIINEMEEEKIIIFISDDLLYSYNNYNMEMNIAKYLYIIDKNNFNLLQYLNKNISTIKNYLDELIVGDNNEYLDIEQLNKNYF